MCDGEKCGWIKDTIENTEICRKQKNNQSEMSSKTRSKKEMRKTIAKTVFTPVQVVSVSDKRLLILLPPWPYPFSVARWF